MPIVAIFEFPGEDVAKYHKVFEAGPAIVHQPARLSHICYRTDNGFTVVDVWAAEAEFAAFGEVIGPAMAAAGLPANPPVVHPVEGTISQDGTRAH
jgi:hypothetical protein